MAYVTVGLISQGYDPPETWPETLKCVTYADDGTAICPEGVTPEEIAKREADILARNLKNSAIETGLPDEDQDKFDGYTTALVIGITKAWSYEATLSEDALLDIPKTSLDALAVFCRKVFDNVELDLSPSPNQGALASDSTV